MITVGEAAIFFGRAAGRCEAELEDLVGVVVERATDLARGYIGHEQDGWKALSTATVYGFHNELRNFRWQPGKLELGYGGFEAPLLRTGQLRDSIESSVDGLTGVVGSTDKVAIYHELGAALARYEIPPRPFLMRSLIEATAGVDVLAGAVAESLLVPD